MRRVVKNHRVQVSLNATDAADLGRLVKIETQRRGELIGEATLLRELAMPRVRELLGDADRRVA